VRGDVPDQVITVVVRFETRIELDALRDFWCARTKHSRSEFSIRAASKYLVTFLKNHGETSLDFAIDEARDEMASRKRAK
jgi:hypothetical protein